VEELEDFDGAPQGTLRKRRPLVLPCQAGVAQLVGLVQQLAPESEAAVQASRRRLRRGLAGAVWSWATPRLGRSRPQPRMRT